MGQDYGRNIAHYDKYADKTVRDELDRCVGLAVKKQLSVLEIGPGTGYLLGKLATVRGVSINYTGIEHSPEMSRILLSRYKYRLRNMKVLDGSVSVKYLAETLSGNRFDLILGSSILHELPDYGEVVRRLAEMLNINGVMYFTGEPVHRKECVPGRKWQDTAYGVFSALDNLLSSPEGGTTVSMAKDGVSKQPFTDLCEGFFRMVICRKYNPRSSPFVSFLENRWLGKARADRFGATRFSIAVRKRDPRG